MTASPATVVADPAEKRREPRYGFDSILLPLLGTRTADHSVFQYLPVDISAGGLGIVIPRWVVERERLAVNDQVDLHVPFTLDGVTYSRGRVVWQRWDERDASQAVGVLMLSGKRIDYPVFVSLNTRRIGVDLSDFATAEGLVQRLIKDCMFLKKGIDIYLKHLIPFFSRIADYPEEDYPLLRQFVLEDMRAHVQRNREKLEGLYEAARRTGGESELARWLDLEELRGHLASEVQVEVLKSAFDSESVWPYLNAIKELEKKQFINYNLLVMLYIKSI